MYDDQLRIAAELDDSGNVVSTFVYGAKSNVPDAMIRGGATYRILSDWRGSVRAVVDATAGAVVETIDYDAWGNATIDDTTCAMGTVCAPLQPFAFAGGLYDRETGLARFGARDYDASIGRWTQKDAIGFGGGQTNIFAYAGGDPINQIDPRGFWGIGVGPAGYAGAGLPFFGGGVEGAVGSYHNFSDGSESGFYEFGAGPEFNSVVSAGFGIQGAVYWNDKQFWDDGTEIGINLPFVGLALELGDDGIPAGVSASWGASIGIDFHVFKTWTGHFGPPISGGGGSGGGAGRPPRAGSGGPAGSLAAGTPGAANGSNGGANAGATPCAN